MSRLPRFTYTPGDYVLELSAVLAAAGISYGGPKPGSGTTHVITHRDVTWELRYDGEYAGEALWELFGPGPDWESGQRVDLEEAVKAIGPAQEPEPVTSAPVDEIVTLTVVMRRPADRQDDPCDVVLGWPGVLVVGHQHGVSATALKLGAEPSSWTEEPAPRPVRPAITPPSTTTARGMASGMETGKVTIATHTVPDLTDAHFKWSVAYSKRDADGVFLKWCKELRAAISDLWNAAAGPLTLTA